MMERLGVVAIVIEDRKIAVNVQEILSAFGEIIIARTGIHDRERDESVISLIVKGTVEQISALTGKLGRLENIQVKSAVTAAKETK
ncbi:MAG TPA: CopG family transcriptional regulator [Clostridia bacterium]|nr:CopG family transcriptional regulator [Clostridia bacterium]